MKKSKHHMPIKERFEQFFDRRGDDECWLWKGHLTAKGYGHFRIGRKVWRSHQVSYCVNVGPIVEGLHVLHSCDNAACVNPAHLSLGTNIQNQIEAWARDRKKNVRKLSLDDVLTIKESKASQRHLAETFNVHQSEISRIKSGKRGSGILRMTPMGVGA